MGLPAPPPPKSRRIVVGSGGGAQNLSREGSIYVSGTGNASDVSAYERKGAKKHPPPPYFQNFFLPHIHFVQERRPPPPSWEKFLPCVSFL